MMKRKYSDFTFYSLNLCLSFVRLSSYKLAQQIPIPNAVSMKGHDFSAENMQQLTFSLIYIDGRLMGRLLDLELNELHQDWYRIESIPLYVEGGEAPSSVVAESVPGEDVPVTRNLDEYAMDAYYLTSTDITGHYEIYTDVVESATPPRLVAYFENDETEITEMYMAEITKKDRVDPRDDRWRWEVSNGLGKAYMDMDGHNPRENPGSRYLCMTGSEPMDFLDVYRMDKEIKEEMKGMTKAQREAYLKELMGWTDEDESQSNSDWLPIDDDATFELF